MLRRNINMYKALADGSKDPLDKQRYYKTSADSEKIMLSIDQYSEVIGSFGTLIMVLGRDDEDFHDKCSRVENTVNVIGCKVRILSSIQKEAYQQISPTHIAKKNITDIANRPFLFSTFVGGFPFANSGFCDDEGFYLAKNSDGGIILYDPWLRDTSRTNSNMSFVGGSGMGKSTAMKALIQSEFARGTKIIIIDPEGEYKDLCLKEEINGSWVDIAGGRGGMINPLQIRPAPRDDDDESESNVGDLAIHIKTLETFFNLYLPSLNDKHRAVLSKSLIELYENFNITWDTEILKFQNNQFPTMMDLFNLVKSKTDYKLTEKHKDIYDDLALFLESAAMGADKGLWNGYTTISGDNKFICLDTKNVSNMGGGVLSAQYFNILSWCWEQISRDKKERVMLIADECWILVDPNCPQSLEFLRNAEKRARKYEGAIVVATQDIVDFIDPSVKKYGQAILDLPSTKFIFGMDGKGLQEIGDVFNLNRAQYELVESKQRGIALMKVGSRAVKVKFEYSDERLASFGKGGGR